MAGPEPGAGDSRRVQPPDSVPDVGRIRDTLREIIGELLEADLMEVADDTPLLDYVTSSLVLVEGLRRVGGIYGVVLSIRTVLEGEASIASLAAYLHRTLTKQGDRAGAPGDDGHGPDGRWMVPLAPSQQHIGFLMRYSDEASAAYNEAAVILLDGRLEQSLLDAAISATIERRPELRSALSADANTVEVRGWRPVLEVAVASADGMAEQLGAIVDRPFTPGEPLFRAVLVQLPGDRHVLALVGHALVVDGEELLAVVREIADLHRALTGDRDALAATARPENTARKPAPDPGSTADPARDAARAFWHRVFADGIPSLALPTDRPRPPVKRYGGAAVTTPVDPDLMAALRSFADKTGTTPDVVVCAAFTLLLHRVTREDDVVVGVGTSTGRDRHPGARPELLPIRGRYEPRRDFTAHVRGLAAGLAAAWAHDQLSLAELIQLLAAPRDQSRSALFTAAFRHEPVPAAPRFGTLDAAVLTPPTARARYDLELVLRTGADEASLRCVYSSELFDEATVQRWLRSLTALLQAGVDDGARPCATLPLVTGPDRRVVVEDWNATGRPYPLQRTALDLIGDQAGADATRVAVRFDDAELTYAALLGRAEELAAMLRTHGLGAGGRLGVLLPRSVDLIPALLAAWRAGAAYVPLDPELPSRRLAHLLGDADVQVVVTTRDLRDRLPDQHGATVVCLDELPPAPRGALPEGMVASSVTDTAYLMYTSGSTGPPKGVEITHRSLTNCLLGVGELLGLGAGDSVLALTTVSFDISLIELFLPLLLGGTVDLAEDGAVRDAAWLIERLTTRRPSFVQATPSTWKALLAAGWPGDQDLCVLSGGEALPRELAEQLLTRSRSLWNLYGPTEATVWATACEVRSAAGQPVRIGRPLPNTQLYIVEDLQPVPVGAVGELLIGGAGLARGYWRNPELTDERFVTSPFRPGERLYRTGDLARYLPDGDVVCLGRVDDQVKVHGIRVEPGEVEAALREVDGVRDAAVTTWTDPHGDIQLVAHVMSGADGPLQPAALRIALRASLPAAIIPAHIRVVDELPLTASGKLDRSALPPPVTGEEVTSTGGPPATPTERLVAAVWAKLLQIPVDDIGRHNDFMDLGGHSLLLTRLMVDVRKLFAVTVSMREFFGASSLQRFAAVIDTRRSAGEGGPAPWASERDGDWASQRMAFLQREAQLPVSLAPARGLVFEPGPVRGVLLTGATGFLGAHLLAEILQATDATVWCLVRPRHPTSGKARVEAQLRHYGLWRGDEAWQRMWQQRVHAVEGDVVLPRLGVAAAAYESLAREVDAVIHSAAQVNFIYPYEALRGTNVAGVHEVIRFAFQSRIKPVHYLSTAAVWPMGAGRTFGERDPLEHGELLNLGYDESKWVAERCLQHAAERGLPMSRYRPGEVGGHSVTGQSPLDHFFIAAMKGFMEFGAFPLVDTVIDVAPVDYVVRALVHIAFHSEPSGQAFHLTNPGRCHVSDALAFLRGLGYRFDELPFPELRDGLLTADGFAASPLFPFQAMLADMDTRSFEVPGYDVSSTTAALRGSGIVCPPVDEELLGRYVAYLRSVDFLPAPHGASTPSPV